LETNSPALFAASALFFAPVAAACAAAAKEQGFDQIARLFEATSAAEQIPKDARGRFITGDGTVFQGYLFNEEQL